MKLSLSIIALALLAGTTPHVFAAPAVGAAEAVKIAQEDLKQRGLAGQYHIMSLVLEPQDVRRLNFRWAVRWSDSIPLDAEKKELGLQIDMDGSVARVVRGAANKNATTGKFDPNGFTGLQNPRTRSTRPSVLDLKH